VKPSQQQTEAKTKPFQKGTRTLVRPRPSKYYPADDVPKKNIF